MHVKKPKIYQFFVINQLNSGLVWYKSSGSGSKQLILIRLSLKTFLINKMLEVGHKRSSN